MDSGDQQADCQLCFGFGCFNYSPPTYRAATVGGGVEHRINSNFSLRAEYRYASFGCDNDFSQSGVTVSSDKELHTARIVGAYRFGAMGLGGSTKDEDGSVQPRQEFVRNWSGFHFSVGTGFDGISGDGSITAPGIGSASGSGTLSAGYDFQVTPNWLIGPVAYFDWSDHDNTVHASGAGLRGVSI